MKEVLPGVYQIILTLSGFSPGSVNSYLIRDNDSYVLIDTGWDSPESVQSLQQHLSEIKIGLNDIRRVIVTHCHIDHFGLSAKLQKSYKAKIYMHQKELDLIKIRFSGGDNFLPLTDKFLQTHGVPASELPPPEVQIPISNDLVSMQPNILLKGGEVITAGEYSLKVINTPGHTPGHVSLYEPQKRFIISGDMLLPTIATNAAVHVQHIDNPMQQYLNSLLVLKELDIDLILPGHENIHTNHRQRIEELFKHHKEKAGEIRKAFSDSQAKTAYDVSRILSWSPKTKAITWNSLSGWDKRFAVLQTIAHLEVMAGDKELTRFSKEGKLYYR
jgi:glyoxylase-like metal-dependent hydrolase (beta-lactamase superfamily II)